MDGEIRQEQKSVAGKRDNSVSELLALRETMQAGSKEQQIVDKRIELSKAQHDNTGSWKGEYFARDIRDGLVERGLETGADGKLPTSAEDLSTHYLLVNMGELDRVNAMGDHSSGDKALESTAKGIRDTLKAFLKDDQFDVYRTAGNDFSVRLKQVDRPVAERITRALCGQVDLSSIGQEAAPIEASLASQSDLISVINNLEPLDRVAFLSTEKPEGPSIGVLKELLQQQNDRQKTESRMRRMQEMIDGYPDKAQDFYEKYQRKVLGPIFAQPGDKEETPEFKLFVERFKAADAESRHRGAENEARRQYVGRRETQRGIDRALGEHAAKQTLGLTGFPEKIPDEEEIPLTEKSENGFTEPKPTRGFEAIAGKRKRVEELKAARENPLDVELASLEADIEAANRDVLTGLAQRGPMFKQLESGLESGKPVGVVYIDMAFLKYFDKEGNGTTGNVAIKKAAELLDGIAAEASKEGIQVEAYRVGGDEFAFGISGGGPDAAEKVKELLVRRQKEAAPIPLQGEGALGKFYKQKLSFNFGSLGPLDLEGMRKLIKDNKLPLESAPGTADERNELAEYALRFADKQLEIQKGFNRIGLLLAEKQAGERDGDSSRYQQLLKYSQKAIFGADGEALINELAAKSEVPGEQVLKFVIDQLKKKGAAKENYENSIDKLIDERVRELYFEQQIKGLKHQITVMEQQLSVTKGENAQLKQKVAELEEEVKNVSNLKQRILAS